MIKRLVAIGFIFVCTSIAWMVLGGTIFTRTHFSDENLRGQVERIWGTQHAQSSPVADYTIEKERLHETIKEGKKLIETIKFVETYSVPLVSSKIKVALSLDYRQKGLLWYSTYKVSFSGVYAFSNPTDQARNVTISLPLPAQNAIYNDVKFSPRGHVWTNNPVPENQNIKGRLNLLPGETVTVDISYQSQGLDKWIYQFGEGVSEVKDFQMTMLTDFSDIDFPADSIAPSNKQATNNGWELNWNFKNLISGVNIGMLMPQKLQPGPLAGQISFFAPVSLFFFIVIMLVITQVKKIDIHPMHFFFISTAFFAFHLLLAYLVDHLSIHVSFIISSIVSLALVISYLRVAIGKRFAYIEAAIAQFVYLILFSYAFFFEGLTGLVITIAAIITLFVMMQMTARINWNEVFSKPAKTNQAA